MEFGETSYKGQSNVSDFDVEEIKTRHRDTTGPTYSELCNNHTYSYNKIRVKQINIIWRVPHNCDFTI